MAVNKLELRNEPWLFQLYLLKVYSDNMSLFLEVVTYETPYFKKKTPNGAILAVSHNPAVVF